MTPIKYHGPHISSPINGRTVIRSAGIGMAVLSGCNLLGCGSSTAGPFEADMVNLRGLAVAARGLDYKALQASLPLADSSQRQLIIVIDDCESCKAAQELPFIPNRTGTQALLVTGLKERALPLGANVSLVRPLAIKGIPPELYADAPAGLLIDFEAKTAVAARGPFSSWFECLNRLRENEKALKENR